MALHTENLIIYTNLVACKILDVELKATNTSTDRILLIYNIFLFSSLSQ
jgi:hypothetical protein